MKLACFAAVSAVSFAPSVFAFNIPRPPPVEATAEAITGTAYFQQYIDHKKPELGTFSQKYFWSDQYYKGPGAPVVLTTPGEGAAAGYEGYLTNKTVTGLFGQAIGGAIIVLEHRYYGESSPYEDLTSKNLQYLTLDNAIADLVHFAKTAELPFDKNCSSKAGKAPWVLSGGSYSGALAAWTAKTSPGTFWAYHASSAPVEAISDYWQYFVPVQEGMPKNCSTDVSLVIDHIDEVLTKGSEVDKQSLKDMFGLGAVKHDDDFAAALANGPWLWQGNQFYRNQGFFQWCDAVENVQPNSTSASLPGASGVGLEKALAGFASWFNGTFLPYNCANYGYTTDAYDTSCFDTYDASLPEFTDRSVNNTFNRQWIWMLCNEPFGYWQDGAPTDRPSIVSRVVTADYWIRQCSLFFPEKTFGIAAGKTEDEENAYTSGWNPGSTKRLIWANGQYDPWRECGVSSEFRPGGPLKSTAQAPIQVIPGGFHCSDLSVRNGLVNKGVQVVIDNEVKQIATWVKQWHGGRN